MRRPPAPSTTRARAFTTALAALAWLLVAPPTLQGQDTPVQCPDLLGAERAMTTCEEFRQVQQCHLAINACRDAVTRCPDVPRFTRALQTTQAVCSAANVTPERDRAALGQACRTHDECAPGLTCTGRRCAAHAKPEARVRALRESARALASHSPCDARALMELACNTAKGAGRDDLHRDLLRALTASRTACRAYGGDLCAAHNTVQGLDGAEMVFVPGGPFQRGSDAASVQRGLKICRTTYTAPNDCEASWFKRETPRKTVHVSPFYIDTYEVTNARYAACVDAGACPPIDYAQCALFQSGTGTWATNVKPGPSVVHPDHPVVCVLWREAEAYCRWAGKRLPTEAEWEKAARGDQDQRVFPWGDTWNGGWLNWGERTGFGSQDRFETTAPVGTFPQNVSPYGAYDMAGNVWEWTSDYHSEDFYRMAPAQNPVNTQVAEHRILRGGSWSFAGNGARVAYRYFAFPDVRDDAIGLRCVTPAPRTSPSPKPAPGGAAQETQRTPSSP